MQKYNGMFILSIQIYVYKTLIVGYKSWLLSIDLQEGMILPGLSLCYFLLSIYFLVMLRLKEWMKINIRGQRHHPQCVRQNVLINFLCF